MKQGDFYKGFKRWEVVKREKRRAGTEYVRRIDDLGRIVIPAEIRKAFGCTAACGMKCLHAAIVWC